MKKPFRITAKHIFWFKALLHTVAFSWLFITYFQAFSDNLGADPVKAILHFTGIGAFNLLLISLCITPVAKTFRQGQLINLRRPIGLYAFCYALCHFISFLIFELQLQWSLIFSELTKRPYISVGFIALLILTALAVTSTKSIQKSMGSIWQKLHNWVYLASLLVALHYIWSVKTLQLQPVLYGLIVFILLATRKSKFTRYLKRRKAN